MELSQPTTTCAQPEATPAVLGDPDRPDEQVFTFSFASGHHPIIRGIMEFVDNVLSRTLYRPFMRFMPISVEHISVPVRCLPPALPPPNPGRGNKEGGRRQ